MNILLVNPPNCGRSIPQEKFGFEFTPKIFRGEPLALEVLAGNLEGYETRILDLKAREETLADVISEFNPQVVGFTCLTCEANTVLRLDHVIDGYEFFIKAGFTPVHRISCPLTWEQFAGFDVKEAKANKRLLGMVRDLLIMEKEP